MTATSLPPERRRMPMFMRGMKVLIQLGATQAQGHIEEASVKYNSLFIRLEATGGSLSILGLPRPEGARDKPPRKPKGATK